MKEKTFKLNYINKRGIKQASNTLKRPFRYDCPLPMKQCTSERLLDLYRKQNDAEQDKVGNSTAWFVTDIYYSKLGD